MSPTRNRHGFQPPPLLGENGEGETAKLAPTSFFPATTSLPKSAVTTPLGIAGGTPSFEREAHFLQSAEKLERRRRLRDEVDSKKGPSPPGGGCRGISFWSSIKACNIAEQISFKF